jgi:hypothetical protein
MSGMLVSRPFTINTHILINMNAVATEAAWFADDHYRALAQDTGNGLISLSGDGKNNLASEQTNLPSSATADDIEGSLSDQLGTYFTLWEDAQVDYLHSTFQGDAKSLIALTQALNDGMMLATSLPDEGALQTELQHIMWAKLVPTAWNIAPEQYLPFIL